MFDLFFVLVILMMICDGIGLNLLKKEFPDCYESLGRPIHLWTGLKKVSYIIGFVGLFKFRLLPSKKLKVVLTIQAMCFWGCLGLFLLKSYQTLS
jgi:hypothetical protein